MSVPSPDAPGRPAGGDRVELLLSLLGIALLLGVVSAAYVRAFDADFQFDDVRTILQNPAVREGYHGAWSMLSSWVHGARPVTDLSFALDYAVAGWDRRQFHATNISLHLVTVVLLFVLGARVLTRARVPRPRAWALGLAAVWAVHPIHTEAVTYVCQRAEVLASSFALLSLLLLLLSEDRRGGWTGRVAYAGAFLAFVAGLAAKPNAAVVPALYLLYATCRAPSGERRGWRAPVLLAAPFLLVVLAGGARTLANLRGNPDVGFEVAGITPAAYWLTQLRVTVTYLRLLLWPARQALDWDVPIAAHLDAATAGAGLLLAGMVGGGVWLLARARRLPVERPGPARVAVFGTGWFFVALAPTSLVPFIDVLYEHRLYLASWGVLLALAAGASAVLGRWSSRRLRWGLIAGAAVAAGALGLATHARNAVWATKETLWADAVAKSPRKPRPHLNLGHALWLRGDNEGALAQYRLAEALDDGRMLPSNRAKLYLDMAAALGALGRYDESIEAALRGLAIDPDGPDILNNIVTSYRRKGEPQKARPFAERAVRVAPRSVEAHTALGHVRADGGDLDAALREFERAAALDPAALDPVVGAALATERLGSATDACRWWQRVARVAPTERLRSDARSRAQRIGCEKS